MGKKIGFFGGTFDPIHFGHINLAIRIQEECGLDEVLFCPAYISPHKLNNPPKAKAQDRYEMVAGAIEEIRGFYPLDVEIRKQQVSFTIDTLRSLKEKYDQDVEFSLIMGKEVVEDFYRWREYNKIMELAPPIIGSRSDLFERYLENYSPSEVEILRRNYVHTAEINISATEIRQRIKKGLYCKHLVPEKVISYIYLHKLYL